MGSRDKLGSNWKTIALGSDTASALSQPAGGPATGTFIGSDARFEGTLQLRGDFRIDSEFRGEIKTDGTLTVGETGSVEGDIHARQVEIRGAVVGDVFARRQLVVYSEARLHGNVETACLEIRRHAFFQGTTAMTRPQASTRAATSDPASLRSQAPAPA